MCVPTLSKIFWPVTQNNTLFLFGLTCNFHQDKTETVFYNIYLCTEISQFLFYPWNGLDKQHF